MGMTPRVARTGLVSLLLLNLVTIGCGGVQDFNLTPTRTASILGQNTYDRFGVCGLAVSLEPPTAPPVETIWGDQSPATSSRGAGLFGYQIQVTRGESCHRRTTTPIQTAFLFDLSEVQSAAIDTAVLQLEISQAPTAFRGSDTQCSMIDLGRAQQAWSEGYHPDQEAGNQRRPLIPYVRQRQLSTQTGLIEIDVQQAIINWKAGTLPNHGFTLTVDADHIVSTAATVERALTDTTAPPGTRAFLCPWTLESVRLRGTALAE